MDRDSSITSSGDSDPKKMELKNNCLRVKYLKDQSLTNFSFEEPLFLLHSCILKIEYLLQLYVPYLRLSTKPSTYQRETSTCSPHGLT